MIQSKENVSEKTRNNAISAYLMIFVSGLFLFNKTNKNINNDFVKGHTKSAILIHLGLLVTYIIFISNSLFSNINILGFSLNIIITNTIFLSLLSLLIIGIYKAKNGNTFNIGNNVKIKKSKILDINGEGKIPEKEKLTILLSFIPFVGFINYAKYKNNEIINETTRLNILISLIILCLYIFGYDNLANLFSLVYIILIVFIGINLFTKEQLIQIKLPNIFSPEKTYIGLASSIKYFKNYFNDKDFISLNQIFKEIENKKIKQENVLEKELEKKKNLKLPKFLIYIPFINLIFIFYRNTKYYFHIINGLIITIIFIFIIGVSYFKDINTNILLLSLFPILFGIGYTQNKLAYKMPIIFDINILIKEILRFFKYGKEKIDKKRKADNKIKLKPKR